MNFKEVLKSAKNYKTTINPIFFYMTILWIVSKIVQKSLNQSHTIWEICWKYFLRAYGDDNYRLYVDGSLMILTVVSLGLMGFFTVMDFSLSPQALRKYKVQEGTNEPPDTKKFIKAILLVIFNGSVVGLLYVMFAIKIIRLRGIPDVHILPSFHNLLIESFICYQMYEVTFYASHRLLHTKYFYQHVHKIHHQWTSSISIVALYCHPLEFLIGNLFPATAGLFLLGCHITSFWFWLFILLTSTIGDHSGYHLPFIHSAEFHDFHHLRFNVNYGAHGWMDRLFGTDASFKGTVNDVRHRNLFTFESAKERFPDACKKIKAQCDEK